MLRKGVHPYEYIDNWKKFDDEALPDKNCFYSNLNTEDITDIDYRHAEKVFKDFNNKNLGGYHDLYVQSNTLLLSDVFGNFRKTCLKIYELDPAQFLSAPGLAWQACLKKTGVKLELLTDPDMILIVKNGIRGGTCQKIVGYAKANNIYTKSYDKNKESSYFPYLDANNLYGWAMSEPLSVDGFDWIEDLSKIDEYFIKNYDKDSDKGCILEVDVKYPKNVYDLHSDLLILPERMKINKCNKLVCNLYDKKILCCSYKIIKTSIKSRINIKEGS